MCIVATLLIHAAITQSFGYGDSLKAMQNEVNLESWHCRVSEGKPGGA